MDTNTPNNDQITPTDTFVDAKDNAIGAPDNAFDAPTLKTSGRWEKPEDDRGKPDVENCPLVTKTVWTNWLCSLKDTSQ
jgi:hypothetical protein